MGCITGIDPREYARQHNINIQERDPELAVGATISPQAQQEAAARQESQQKEAQQKYDKFHAKSPKEQRADLKKLIQEYEKKIDEDLSHQDIYKYSPLNKPEQRKAQAVASVMEQMKAQMFSDGMIDKATHDVLNIADIKATSAKHQFFKFVYKVLDSASATKDWNFKASVYNKMLKAETIATIRKNLETIQKDRKPPNAQKAKHQVLRQQISSRIV